MLLSAHPNPRPFIEKIEWITKNCSVFGQPQLWRQLFLTGSPQQIAEKLTHLAHKIHLLKANPYDDALSNIATYLVALGKIPQAFVVLDWLEEQKIHTYTHPTDHARRLAIVKSYLKHCPTQEPLPFPPSQWPPLVKGLSKVIKTQIEADRLIAQLSPQALDEIMLIYRQGELKGRTLFLNSLKPFLQKQLILDQLSPHLSRPDQKTVKKM